MAPSHASKDALANSLGIDAGTLAGWLQSPTAAKGPRLLIVDESGMADTQTMAALFATLAPEDRVLLVGDPRQLSPVAAGQPFAEILDQRPTTPTLGEIRRQRDAAQRRIATLYSQGKGAEAARALLGFTREVEQNRLIQSAAHLTPNILSDVSRALGVFRGSQKAVESEKQRRARIDLSGLGIEPGAVLTFSRDESITATVQPNNKVDYRGSTCSLSAAALNALTSLGYQTKAASGSEYWMYEGETLDERRRRLEEERFGG